MQAITHERIDAMTTREFKAKRTEGFRTDSAFFAKAAAAKMMLVLIILALLF